MRKLLLAMSVIAAAGCAPRGQITLDPAAQGVGTDKRDLGRDDAGDRPRDGKLSARSGRVRSASRCMTSRCRRTARSGEISWPKKGRAPDPQTEFLTTDDRSLPVAECVPRKPGQRSCVKSRRASGAPRFLSTASTTPLPRVCIAWRSCPTTSTCRTRSSTTRGPLRAKRWVTSTTGIPRWSRATVSSNCWTKCWRRGRMTCVLACHSMGCQLMMEVDAPDRDIGIPASLSREVASVIMLSPDIDVSVFFSQAQAIEELPEPFFIFSSQKDKALAAFVFHHRATGPAGQHHGPDTSVRI